MSQLGLAAALAWQLARGQRRRLLLVVACMAVGAAAWTAVAALADTVADGVALDARALLGGDLEVASNQPLSAARAAELARLLPAGSTSTRQVILMTMARDERTGRAHLVELHAVEPAVHPLGGSCRIVDAAGREVGAAALVSPEPGLALPSAGLELLGARVGDRLRIGSLELPIIGTLLADPGLGANPFVPGPRLLAPLEVVARAGLSGAGARVRHAALVRLVDPAQAAPLGSRLRAAWGITGAAQQGFGGRVEASEGVQVRTAQESQQALSRTIDVLGDYLGLVALLALLMGGVGVASVMRASLDERREAVALLQILGASVPLVQAAAALQALALGALGGAVGAVAGLAAAAVGARLLGSALNLPVSAAPWAHAVILGISVGLGAACAGLFAWLPILDMRAQAPLAVLRGDPPGRLARIPVAVVLAATTALVAAAASAELQSWRIGCLVIGGLAVAAALVHMWSRIALPALAAAARRLPASLVAVRHACANLARAGGHRHAAVVAVALAVLLATNGAVHEASLAREIGGGDGARSSLFCLDVPEAQRGAFAALVRAQGGVEPEFAPMVIARLRDIVRVAGQPAGEAGGEAGGGTVARAAQAAAPSAPQPRWKGREVRLSWRDELSSDESIRGGRWLHDDPAHAEASVEARYAASLGLRLHDHLALEVEGTPIDAEVTSLRTVRWLGLRPNFFVLLNPAALRGAPAVWIAGIPAMPPARRAQVQEAVARDFAGVTVLDIADIAARVAAVVEAVGSAARVLGGCVLLSACLVLLGIGVASGRERRADAALVRVLGGRNRTVLAAVAWEFAALGAVGAAAGLAAGLGLAVAVIHTLGLGLAIPWHRLAALGAGAVVTTAVAGVAACARAVTEPPLAVLRAL